MPMAQAAARHQLTTSSHNADVTCAAPVRSRAASTSAASSPSSLSVSLWRW